VCHKTAVRSGSDRRIFWQEQELGPGGADERAHGVALEAAKIVPDENVAEGLKGFAIDRPLQKPWCLEELHDP
jgi:hypothetical protein